MSKTAQWRRVHDLFLRPEEVRIITLERSGGQERWATDRYVLVNLRAAEVHHLWYPQDVPDGTWALRAAQGPRPEPCPDSALMAVTPEQVANRLDDYEAATRVRAEMTCWGTWQEGEAASRLLVAGEKPVWVNGGLICGWERLTYGHLYRYLEWRCDETLDVQVVQVQQEFEAEPVRTVLGYVRALTARNVPEFPLRGSGATVTATGRRNP